MNTDLKEVKKIEKCSFPLALMHLHNDGHAKREIIKNDTVITLYNGRLYHHCLGTGIRYSYVPTNADLQAQDWELLFILDDELQMSAMKNSLLEGNMKLDGKI